MLRPERPPKKARQEAQEDRRRRLAEEAVVKQFLAASAELLVAGLQELGLYQHHRGEWRRRREQEKE